MSERKVKSISLGKWSIVVQYRVEEGGIDISEIRIAPLYPFEAEMLSTELGMAWSYDEKNRQVTLVPRKARPLSEEELKTLLKALIASMSLIVPGLVRELSLERLREKLLEKGWVVHLSPRRLRSRKRVRVRGVDGYAELDVTATDAGYSEVLITLSLLPPDVSTATACRSILVKKGWRVLTAFPVLKAVKALGECINSELPPLLDKELGELKG